MHSQLCKIQKEVCPNFPIINVPNATVLARAHLHANQHNIDARLQQQAADFFRVPAGQRCIFIGPEFFCRNYLMKNEKFQVKSEDGKSITGVMPCCPHCESNRGVSHYKFECKATSQMPRMMINTDASRMPLFGVRCQCSSPDCVGPVPPGEPTVWTETQLNTTLADRRGAKRINLWFGTGAPIRVRPAPLRCGTQNALTSSRSQSGGCSPGVFLD